VPLHVQLENLTAWFDDHEIADLWATGPQRVPLWRMARSLGRWRTTGGQGAYAAGTAPVSAERDLLTCAFRGRTHRPPASLLHQLLQRIHADGRVDLPRAALLRLLLNRRGPVTGPVTGSVTKEILVSSALDSASKEPAYMCGRVFAVFESIQYEALRNRSTGKGPNATIADKFFGAAMTSPLAVTVMLRKNATGHLKRLRREKPAAAVALANRLDDLFQPFEPIQATLPRTLDLPGQGLFILGYHHQRAADRAAARANTQTDTTSGT
jgi:CRISPR-associated protein Csd1